MWCVPQLSPLILYRGASCVVCASVESTDIAQGCQLCGVCVPQLSPLILPRGASCVVCASVESTDIVQGCQLCGVCLS